MMQGPFRSCGLTLGTRAFLFAQIEVIENRHLGNISMTTKTPSLPPRVVSAFWQGGMRCDLTAGPFRIIVDEPARYGGTDAGPQPTDLLLASVASCFALSVAYVARKRGIDLSAQNIEVTGTYEGLKFRAIDIRLDLSCDPAAVEGLISDAQRLCYVTNTLLSDVDISISFTPHSTH